MRDQDQLEQLAHETELVDAHGQTAMSELLSLNLAVAAGGSGDVLLQ